MSFTPTVLVGPSGVGKGTLLGAVAEAYPQVWLSVSATTRAPRPGEIHAQHYFFLSNAEFEDLISNDGFLEWANYSTFRYGTPRHAVEEKIAAGRAVIMEVETQGALQIMEKMDPLRTIFVVPPSLEVLELRLRRRGTESEEQIASRLQAAKHEMRLIDRFDHILVNDQLAQATAELVNLLELTS